MLNTKWIKVIFGLFGMLLAVGLWKTKLPRKNGAKVLNVMIPCNVDTLDPAVSTSAYSVSMMHEVYDSLLEYHYLKRPFELVPNLVQDMPRLSEDGRVYTFVLKPGVFFHDDPCFSYGKGRELIAEDVVYSLKRLADPSVKSPYYTTFSDQIVGFRQLHKHLEKERGDYSFDIDGIKAIDTYTVQFTLTKPCPLFLYNLAMSCCKIVAKEAVDFYGPDFVNHPVGTGPFILKDYSPNDNKLVFVRNERFRDKFYPTEAAKEYQHLLGPSGRKLPFLDKVVVHVVLEGSTRWLQFKNRDIDILAVPDEVLGEVVDGNMVLKDALAKEKVVLHAGENFSIRYVGFNCFRAPLDNKKVRQAMSLAFDREAFIKTFLMGLGGVQQGFIPRGLFGYDPGFINPYHYDLDRAKRYMADAGYPNGKGLSPIALMVPSGAQHKAWAEFFAKCMEKLGIKIEVQQLLFPELLRKLHAGQYMLSMLGWLADYPDASSSLVPFRLVDIGGGISICDDSWNSRYDKSLLISDIGARAKEYSALNEQIMELVPVIPLPRLPVIYLSHSRVKNYAIDPANPNQIIYLDVEEG